MEKLRYFNKKHIRVLLLLIILDLIGTLTWFFFYGIEEANPLLSSSIKDSPLQFIAIKLGLSLPSLYLLNKYIKKKAAQLGLALLLLCYSAVAAIHFVIFIYLIQ